MRLLLYPVFLCLAILFIARPTVSAQQATVQVVFASEMPDIADPKRARYAELKRLILNERKRIPTTFFLFGGGSIGPSALSNLDRGSHIIDLLNSVEPDAMGVAKREFSYDVDELSLRSYEAAFPIVASNLRDKRINAVPDGLTDRALITRNNVTLGFISISDQYLVKEYLLRDIVVEDKETRTRVIARELRAAGADFIIVHYFDSFPDITKLLDNKVIDYAYISITPIDTDITDQLDGDKRIFVLDKPGHAMVASFEAKSDFPLVSLKVVNLSTVSPDAYIKNQIHSYLLRLNRLLDDNIAYWDDSYSTLREDVRGKENAFANFVVDTMREFSKADIAIINGGSIRGNATYSKNTQITRRTIATELPFRATLTVISVSGNQLLDALEVGFSGLEGLRGTFPQISGMKVEYDSYAPKGNRVVSVSINGNRLDTDKKYRLATTDYLASGGDGYVTLSTDPKESASEPNQAILISDLIMQTLRIKGKLDSQLDQRIIDKASRP